MRFEVAVILGVALLVRYAMPVDLGAAGQEVGTGPTITSPTITSPPTDNVTHEGHVGIHVASFKFDYVSVPLVTCLYLFVTALSKVLYHHADFLSAWLPESCILIVLGVIAGVMFHFTEHSELNKVFTPYSFFLFLLPPIILEAAYSLHDRTFADNLGTILVFAVLGTLLNWALIGPLLYGFTLWTGFDTHHKGDMTFVHCLTFSALISAVDPVAVLAIFEDIGVNHTLYFLVFGESLLNDAVTVVLYNMMTTFAEMTAKPGVDIPITEVLLGGCAFFTVSLGGLCIGALFGLLTALILRFTHHVRVVEPMLVFLMAYMAYLVAELFHWSGIISMIGCGLMQAQYAFQNISTKSLTTVKYFSKLQSAVSESVIFLFLGQALVSPDHEWQTGFVLFTLAVVFVIRFMVYIKRPPLVLKMQNNVFVFTVVFTLAFMANRTKRLRRITVKEQFIMAYGGLRGAVSFALAHMLDVRFIPHSDLFLTTTLTVIFFTVFLQGATIRPLVKLLDITLHSSKQMSLFGEIDEHVRDHLLSGIEEIIGSIGDNKIRTWLDSLDHKYFKRWLQRNPEKKTDGIMHMFEKIALQQHYANLPGSKAALEYAKKNSSVPADGSESTPQQVMARLSVDHSSYNGKIFLDDLIENEGGHLNPAMLMDDDGEGLRRRAVTVSTCERRETQRESLRDIDPQVLRHLLSWKPDRSLHQNYDPNLHNEDRNDFRRQMSLKQNRTRKMSRSLSVTSRGASPQPGHIGVDMGSDEEITAKADNHTLPSWASDSSATSSRRVPSKKRKLTPTAQASIAMHDMNERHGRSNRAFDGIEAIVEETEDREEEIMEVRL